VTASSSEFFSKVSTRSDRERAFRHAIERKSELHCKSEAGDFLYLIPDGIVGSTMVAELARKSSLDQTKLCTVSFMIGQERFFLKTRITPKTAGTVNLHGNNLVELDLQVDLYKLQRRDLYRLVIPLGVPLSADFFQTTNGVTHKHRLHDLSGGGLCIELLPGADCRFQKGDLVEGRVKLTNLLDKSITGKVAYVQTYGSMGSGIVRVGVQFTGIEVVEREKIVQAVWDLHRDLYALMK
jgi:hypothetical protein